LKQDFVIAEGFKGPGRFLGCAVGIRVTQDDMGWYGEGEMKAYLDGDKEYPTICGTGLEDYVGTAWGMEQHIAEYAGVPVFVAENPEADMMMPDFVSFYRWHLPDPILFQKDIKVVIQQIGGMGVPFGEEHLMEEYTPAGVGWVKPEELPGMENAPLVALGLAERTDDYSAAAFVYCLEVQAVPRLNVAAATVDIGRKPYEKLSQVELDAKAIAGAKKPE
jgi:hypothetical protein